jgi:V8-like Glu-specific endopeptidase
MKLTDLFRQPRLHVLGALTLVLLAAMAATDTVSAAGFGDDDRIARPREKGTIYGAIGLMVHSNGFGSEAGTGFLVSPCHVMTAYHVVAGKGKITERDTATFYVGEGSEGPDYSGGRRYAESATAHPVVWGSYIDGESDNITQRVKAVQSNGWNDWVLMKLDKCLGDPANGWGYLKLEPVATRDLTRAGETPEAIAVGLPKDKAETTLTEDPSCRLVGQMYESGWQHDCLTLPGNSGGPILERKPSKPGAWPRVLGITVSLILLDGMDQEAAEAALLSADDPSYFTLLSTAVPVSAFINKVAQYLPDDPEIAGYIAKHSLDSGYSRGDDIDYDGSIADLDQALKAKPTGGGRRNRCGDRGLHQGAGTAAELSGGFAVAQPEPLRPRRQCQGRPQQSDRRSHDLDRPVREFRRVDHEPRLYLQPRPSLRGSGLRLHRRPASAPREQRRAACPGRHLCRAQPVRRSR